MFFFLLKENHIFQNTILSYVDLQIIPKDICQRMCRTDCSQDAKEPICAGTMIYKNEYMLVEKVFDNMCEMKNHRCETGYGSI